MRGIPLLSKHEGQRQPWGCHNMERQRENKTALVRMPSPGQAVFGWCVGQSWSMKTKIHTQACVLELPKSKALTSTLVTGPFISAEALLPAAPSVHCFASVHVLHPGQTNLCRDRVFVLKSLLFRSCAGSKQLHSFALTWAYELFCCVGYCVRSEGKQWWENRLLC